MNALVTHAATLPGLAQELGPGGLGAFKAATDVAACAMPLLRALGWRGEPRQVAEAMPHFADDLDVAGLRGLLARLGYVSRPSRGPLAALDARLLPCLFVSRDRGAFVVIERRADGFHVFDGVAGCERDIAGDTLAGTAYCFRRTDRAGEAPAHADAWFAGFMRRFLPLGGPLLGLTLWLNLMALAVPLFVMVVYDRVIAAGSYDTLTVLLIGAALALGFDVLVRTMRTRALSHVGSRVEGLVGAAVFDRVLGLPPQATERSSTGAQIAKIKEFDRLRDAFSGHLALTLLELPFVVISLVAIAILGGWLVAIPILSMGLYVAAAFVILPSTRRAVAAATAATGRRHSLLIESLSNLAPIRRLGAERMWTERMRRHSAEAAFATFKAGIWSSLAQTLTHGMMTGTGLAVLVVGADHAIEGLVSVGALVAIMALTWRTLAPLHAGLGVVGKLAQLRASIAGVDRLMALRPERAENAAAVGRRRFVGRVTIARASFRHAPDSDPALLGVDLDIRAGEVVALVGASGAGKSTLLRLVAGLAQPQAGAVMIDGINVRQIDPVQLRQSVAFLPQTIHLFHGTVAQNLRLAEPTADDRNLAEAAALAGVLEEILELPRGFDERLDEAMLRALPRGFQQRLILARTYLRQGEIVLLDEPGTELDAAGDKALLAAIGRLRGRATILMSTHRPSHMRVADRVAVMARGQLRLADKPDIVLPRLEGLLE
jgi:ATP-binding cassette subfamily C protein/ATP-binding cassette subfamily C protein LapB